MYVCCQMKVGHDRFVRFVPLVDYHGGGAAAAFEPLSDNIVDYEWALAQYLGAGVAACYRGYELYDSPETKAMVWLVLCCVWCQDSACR
jgi:hypothetical protein